MAGHRVLVLADAYPGSASPAANAFIHAQALSLARLGCQLLVFAPLPWVPPGLALHPRYRRLGASPGTERFAGIEVRRPRFPRPPGRWFRRFAGTAISKWTGGTLARIVDEFRPDILHAHMALPMGDAGLVWARSLNLPLVVTVHGLDVIDAASQGHGIAARTVSVLEGADQVVAVSRYLADRIVDLGARPRRLVVHHVGVDTSRFRFDPGARREWRSRLDIADEAYCLCFVGRLVEDKGIDDLIAIARRLKDGARRVVIVVAGDGAERPRIERAVRTSGLAPLFRLLREIEPGRVPGVLSASDLMVMPTRREGFGLVLLEAQACGLPVVAYATGGVHEAVDERGGNRLIEPGDFEGFLRAVRESAEAGPRRQRDSSEAGRFVGRSFDIDDCSRSLARTYSDLLDDRQNRTNDSP